MRVLSRIIEQNKAIMMKDWKDWKVWWMRYQILEKSNQQLENLDMKIMHTRTNSSMSPNLNGRVINLLSDKKFFDYTLSWGCIDCENVWRDRSVHGFLEGSFDIQDLANVLIFCWPSRLLHLENLNIGIMLAIVIVCMSFELVYFIFLGLDFSE